MTMKMTMIIYIIGVFALTVPTSQMMLQQKHGIHSHSYTRVSTNTIIQCLCGRVWFVDVNCGYRVVWSVGVANRRVGVGVE